MVPLVGFQRDLLERFKLLALHFLDFRSEHGFWLRCRVNTAGLDGNNVVASVFEEMMCVKTNNTGLGWKKQMRADGNEAEMRNCRREKVA